VILAESLMVNTVKVDDLLESRIGGASAKINWIDILLRKAVEETDATGDRAMAGFRISTFEEHVDFLVAIFGKAGSREHGQKVLFLKEKEVLIELIEKSGGDGALVIGGEASVEDELAAERVDSTDIHLGDVKIDTRFIGNIRKERAETFFQLEGGFFGESGKVDLIGGDFVKDDEVEGTPEEDTGFARTRTSGKEEWTINMEDGCTLAFAGFKTASGKEIFKFEFDSQDFPPVNNIDRINYMLKRR